MSLGIFTIFKFKYLKKIAWISKIKAELASSIYSHNILTYLLFIHFVGMEKAHCSRSNFFEKELLSQRTIQKKSASGCRTLPCLVIYFRNFILIWKCWKCSLNRGTLVSATVIYQTKCPFTVLSALFWFFWTLPYDSRLFPVSPFQGNISWVALNENG